MCFYFFCLKYVFPVFGVLESTLKIAGGFPVAKKNLQISRNIRLGFIFTQERKNPKKSARKKPALIFRDFLFLKFPIFL